MKKETHVETELAAGSDPQAEARMDAHETPFGAIAGRDHILIDSCIRIRIRHFQQQSSQRRPRLPGGSGPSGRTIWAGGGYDGGLQEKEISPQNSTIQTRG